MSTEETKHQHGEHCHCGHDHGHHCHHDHSEHCCGGHDHGHHHHHEHGHQCGCGHHHHEGHHHHGLTIDFDGEVNVSADFLWNIIVNETEKWFSELEWTDFRAGGTLEYRSDDAMADYMILDVEAPELVAFTWDNSTIAIELIAREENVTTLRFTNWIEAIDESTAHYLTRWMLALQNLAAYAQGEPVEEDMLNAYEEILPKMREMLEMHQTDVEFE
ncbi:hypothetical protein KBI51_02200 [Aerococcaceae bacterium zg-ZUI334]|uniref:SRPBCC domain-containing protein n=1 Tax=Aerococcaceae TaxID=186827 RepID=UPI00193538A1|nr:MULTISPECIES: SRPBCC domain-containing protein [unclassified Facklamia]MBR7926986.1 hypothetical protein [Aerococcaceae bacterium zg-ZUI334]QQD66354.1 hypothetical protein JDW14_04465 [Aerococcaceae bacterium zg-252]